ncbi:uncharacterized protein N7496_004698 [Penicillium cataractarum]|uniref:Uncharacterized protein n=1 Tax=Penicillium cataractarum TaxID=2100454 RepID=A0A9W9VE06_9EURO|nr:uncharacterized protein N7496_004698 [Penicillium cataractarum]KAJ5377289.1 hypothetical protein N7496_004698 [Penicillium cataractarum]
MWKSKNWLDRDYGSIMPANENERNNEYDEENLIPLTIFPDLEDPDEVKPKHLLLFILSILCFILTGIFVLALISVRMSDEPVES